MNIFLSTLFLLVTAGMLVFLYARLVEPRLLDVVNVTISPDNLAQAGQGLRIVQFSDLHVSDDDHASKLSDLVREINAQEADIVVFTGDLFDNFRTYEGDTQKVIEALSAMKAAHGKFAVLGNHDYEKSAQSEVVRILTEGGFEVLRGERRVLSDIGITITGFDDALFGTDPEKTDITGAEGVHLLLVHEPDVAGTLDAGLYDLMLSGHTHGGQVNLPFLESVYLPKLGRIYTRGLYHPGGEEARGVLYVNRGIGESLLPLRLGSVPELTVFTLE